MRPLLLATAAVSALAVAAAPPLSLCIALVPVAARHASHATDVADATDATDAADAAGAAGAADDGTSILPPWLQQACPMQYPLFLFIIFLIFHLTFFLVPSIPMRTETP